MKNLTHKDFPNVMKVLEEKGVSTLAAMSAIERDINSLSNKSKEEKSTENKGNHLDRAAFRQQQIEQHQRTIGELARKNRKI